jgi:hypothetical protein
MPPPITLVWPADRYLESYAQALQAGWSPNNLRPDARFDELENARWQHGSKATRLSQMAVE